MIEKLASRSGLPTVSVNGILLHSRFNPEKEAEKFIRNTLDSSHAPRTIVLLGESIGYLTKSIERLIPSAKIITVCYSSPLFPDTSPHPAHVWHPGKNISIEDFLSQAIDEIDYDGLHVIEWPPSAAVYPDISIHINRTLAHVLQKIRGNILTTSSMGKLWIRNSFFNFANISSVCHDLGSLSERQLVIAGSGPSLEKAGQLLRKARDRITLISLPSALDYLVSHEITPDIVVMTDPGFYSSMHLHPLNNSRITIAMPLSASRGLWKLNNAVACFIEQPYFFERELLSSIRVDAMRIPPQGTVASTALILATKLTDKEIVCTGLDFCTNDIISHARPNTFERVLYKDSNRTSPLYSIVYQRVSSLAGLYAGKQGCRTSIPLKTYAGWFHSLPQQVRSRVFQLHPSEAGVNTLTGIDESEFMSLVTRNGRTGTALPQHILSNYPERSDRLAIISSILDKWDEEIKRTINGLRETKRGNVRIPNRVTDLLFFFDSQRFMALTPRLGVYSSMKTLDPFLDLVADARLYISTLSSRCSIDNREEE